MFNLGKMINRSPDIKPGGNSQETPEYNKWNLPLEMEQLPKVKKFVQDNASLFNGKKIEIVVDKIMSKIGDDSIKQIELDQPILSNIKNLNVNIQKGETNKAIDEIQKFQTKKDDVIDIVKRLSANKNLDEAGILQNGEEYYVMFGRSTILLALVNGITPKAVLVDINEIM